MDENQREVALRIAKGELRSEYNLSDADGGRYPTVLRRIHVTFPDSPTEVTYAHDHENGYGRPTSELIGHIAERGFPLGMRVEERRFSGEPPFAGAEWLTEPDEVGIPSLDYELSLQPDVTIRTADRLLPVD